MSNLICIEHMIELVCIRTGELVFYPVAQRIYHGDVFRCPRVGCGTQIMDRAPEPALEIFHEEYAIGRERANYSMWNV